MTAVTSFFLLEINEIQCVVLIAMMTFDELSCLPKERVKRVFQSETDRESGVINKVFACMYLSKNLNLFQ